MSFGFGIGDFLTVLELASKVRHDWIDAPGEYAAIKDVIKDLDGILHDIGDLGTRIDLTPGRELALRNSCKSCRTLLDQCEKLINKYSTIQDGRNPRQKLRRMWQYLKLDPDDIRHLRDQLSSQVQQLNTLQLAIECDLVCDVYKGIDKLQQTNAQRRRDTVADWFSSRAFANQQTDQLAHRQTGTGVWFLQCPQYCQWRDLPNSTLLCPGIPGSGKSVMVATVVDNLLTHVEGQKKVLVTYLYCNFNRQAEQSLYHLLAVLVRQLFQEQPYLPEAVEDLYCKHQARSTRPTVDELKTLVHALAHIYDTIFIAIDALDECANMDHARDKFLDELFLLQASSDCNVNILATTRFIPEVTKRFSAYPKLEIRAHDEDIRHYLDDNMSKLSSFVLVDTKIQDEIKCQITDAADGMFLLARLHFDSLRDKTNRRKLRAALSSLRKDPNALDKAYDDAFKRIGLQLDGFRDLAYRALIWITHARRELSIEELQEAIAIEPGMESLNHDEDIDSEHDIVSVCAGLVVVDQQSRIVHLVHYTTQEYLERVRDQKLPGGSVQIAQSCLDYLYMATCRQSHLDWCMDLSGLIEQYKLLEYVGQNWGEHAFNADDEKLRGSMKSLLEDKNRLRIVCRLSLTDILWDDSHIQRISNISVLHIYVHFDLVKQLEMTIAEGTNINAADGEGCTPLSWAAISGRMDILRLLLAEPAIDVNAQDRFGGTALHEAAGNRYTEYEKLMLTRPEIAVQIDDKFDGAALTYALQSVQIDVMRLLLAQPGIELNAQNSSGETPLHMAAREGHTEVVRLLISQPNVNINIKDNYGETPLHQAALCGHLEVLRLFLSHPDHEVNIKDEDGKTPVYHAIMRGQVTVVELLLAQVGIELNTSTGDGRTPLSSAAGWGQVEIVRLLLARPDVEVRTCDENGKTPLHDPAQNGHAKIVELLLSQPDMELNLQDKYGMTPLACAALYGRVEVVQLLLAQSNSGINTRSYNGETPLLKAANCGHMEVVELLLAHPGVEMTPTESSYVQDKLREWSSSDTSETR